MSGCSYLVTWANDGRVPPRPCSRFAKTDSLYRGLHERLSKRYRPVLVREGGFCVGCAAPARTYVVGGVSIGLCAACGRALKRAIEGAR